MYRAGLPRYHTRQWHHSCPVTLLPLWPVLCRAVPDRAWAMSRERRRPGMAAVASHRGASAVAPSGSEPRLAHDPTPMWSKQPVGFLGSHRDRGLASGIRGLPSRATWKASFSGVFRAESPFPCWLRGVLVSSRIYCSTALHSVAFNSL